MAVASVVVVMMMMVLPVQACYPSATVKFSPDYSMFESDPFYESRAAAGIKTYVVLRSMCA